VYRLVKVDCHKIIPVGEKMSVILTTPYPNSATWINVTSKVTISSRAILDLHPQSEQIFIKRMCLEKIVKHIVWLRICASQVEISIISMLWWQSDKLFKKNTLQMTRNNCWSKLYFNFHFTFKLTVRMHNQLNQQTRRSRRQRRREKGRRRKRRVKRTQKTIARWAISTKHYFWQYK